MCAKDVGRQNLIYHPYRFNALMVDSLSSSHNSPNTFPMLIYELAWGKGP